MKRVTCKYADWTRGQVEALINIIGEENAKGLLTGDISTKFEEVVKGLFDRHGRRIPKDLQANVCDADRDFRLNQPKLETDDDYAIRLVRLHESLNVYTGVNAKDFRKESENLWAKIQGNSQIVGITNGVGLPIVLPQLTTDDLGKTLEQYLEAVGKSYNKTFSDRSFDNNYENDLADKVSVVDGSRHDQLIERMKQGPVLGIHFPNPLQGYSIDASLEQMSTLPEGFVLSGLDTTIAMVMYPDIIACGQNTPGQDLVALSWQSACSFCFGSNKNGLDFGGMYSLAYARASYSSGLLFLG